MLLMICFGIAIITLFSIFNRKSLLNKKEKEIMRATYDKIILQSQLEIQEQTFNVISSELHDNVGQVLSLAKVQINIMNERHEMNSEMLDLVKENIGKAMSDLRDIARGLSSDRIRMLSICETVEEELERINKSGILRACLAKQGQECRLDEQKKLILFRIIQESIQNCIKHAAATELTVSFLFDEGQLRVCIKDNGKGFDQQEAQPRNGGLGLMNIKRRAWLAGGEARVESSLHGGTSVDINIPYE
jgi:signal transduction histidine kinase